ncbi:MAG: hypothetical protein Q9168_002495 [Polycauliona sp. 1 TL-2023]
MSGKFHLTIVAAKVVESYRDDDGYGNFDSDYLTLSLKIPAWSEYQTLLARVPMEKGEKKPPLEMNKFYAIQGALYFKVPQKDWHQGYLRIIDHKEVPDMTDDLAREAGNPRFDLVCNISRVTSNNKVGLLWRCWDEYEGATYPQVVEIPCPLDKPTIEGNSGKLWKINGRLTGPENINIIEPARDVVPL